MSTLLGSGRARADINREAYVLGSSQGQRLKPVAVSPQNVMKLRRVIPWRRVTS